MSFESGSYPFKDSLWEKVENLHERAVLVISLSALRSRGHNVPHDVAVETKARELWWHMRTVSELKNLMKFRHVLIRDNYGVFHFDGGTEKPFSYYFRPFKGGPEYSPKRYGWMSGYEKILVASIVKNALHSRPEDPSHPFVKIGDGICAGLKLWTKHFDCGLSEKKFPLEYWKKERDYEEPHPYDHLFSDPKLSTAEADGIKIERIEKKEVPVAWVQFRFSELQIGGYTNEELKTWSRVDWVRTSVEVGKKEFSDFLVAIVKHGLSKAIEKFSTQVAGSSCKNFCPVAQFGDLEVVDQDEINGFSDVYRIIVKYLEDDNWKLPLSLAVFGPPGAGKSFVVKEILKAARTSTRRASNDDAPVYNLAQFTESKNLTTAFHQVQDKALSEEVPLIFFDEFDAKLGNQEYGWLKYFLAPMQDGKFKGAESEGSYRVGRAIFVFAGGTAQTFHEFNTKYRSENESMEDEAKIDEAWKLVKGPDFISRLRGYLDIKGINALGKRDVSDLLALRRAIILRSILTRKAKDIFDAPGKIARINKGLINAFLRVGSYVHQTRSMEAIVEMSRPEQGEFRVASLPSREQLRMHVKDVDFLKLAGI